MQTSNGRSAARTAADLDEMDNKLRRLGLDMDHPNTTPPAFAPLAAHDSTDYIHSIRAAKAEKQQARLDRSARLATAVEKQQSSNAAAAVPLAPGAIAGASRVDHITSGDRALLASDVVDAALKAIQKRNSDREQQLEVERMLKVTADRRKSRIEESDQLPSASPSKKMAPLSLTAATPKRWECKRQEAAVWCEGVARGLVELAIEVSDNRHLPATGLGGRPVYRLHQDLSVTQWRQWVEQLVFPESVPTATMERTRRGDDGAAGIHSEIASVSLSRSAEVQQQLPQQIVDANLQLEAEKCIASATESEAQEAARAQTEAVSCVLAQLHAEVVRQRKAAEEAVRLAADEANLSAPPDAQSVLDVAGTPRREELLPGWAQRMPPAACFVYGDDLSGARLLANTVDLCALRKFHHQQQTPSSHSPNRRLPASHQGLLGTGENVETTATDSPPNAPSAAVPPKDPYSLFVVSEIGVESSDPALTEGGAVATYVTPRTLLGNGAPGAVGGEAKRNGSAGRSQRTQPHSSTGCGNVVGGGSTSQGAAATAASGSSSGTAHRCSPRVTAMSSEGRRESDQLIDALVREVVRVHRHNLGVLAGDRMPSWAPKPPTTAAPADLPATEEEGNNPNVAAQASVPLRTLFLVGFPESAYFAEVLARRLRQAMVAVEMELMDMEGRRRLAERQAAVAAAAAAEWNKQRSSSPAKGVKGASPGPGRSKGSRSSKSVVGAEEQAVSAIVEALQATVAMPPLGVLAVFLVLDLPTRQPRLEAASFVTDATAAQRASADDDDDPNHSAGVSGVGPLRTLGPEYNHPVYNPSAEDIQSCGPLSMVKELSSTLPTSFRRGGPSGASPSSSLTLFSSCSGPASSITTTAASLCAHTWSVERLRTELKQQHAQQHRQRKDWTAAVVDNGRQGGVGHSSGVPPGAAAFPRHPAKRRDKPTMSTNTNFSSTSSDLERVNACQHRVSVSVAARAAEPPAAAGLKAPEERGLPRVLFFVRMQDVSDPAAPSTSSADCRLDPKSLGTAIWRAAATSQLEVGNPLYRCAEARARTVNELTAQLRLLCCPAAGRVLTNESLAPRQLAEPFRLGDYRLAESTCAHLKETNKAFLGTLPAVPVPQSFERSRTLQGEALAIAARDALAAEAEVWATVMQYSEQLYHLVAKEVFTNGLASPEGPAAPPAAVMINTAAQFTIIDQSYARAKEAMSAHTAYAIPHLEDCLTLLLRLSVDVCLSQLAASVRLLCESVTRHHQMETGALVDVSVSSSVDSDDNIDQELLRVAPRLSLEAARGLIDSLRSVDAREASAMLSAELAKVYWPQVTAAAAKVAVQHFTSRSLHNLAGVAPSLVTSRPPSQQQTQAITDKSESAGDSNAGTTARKPEAKIMAEEHVPAAVQLLLEHAINAPAPLTRVALLLRESQRMVCAARDGAEAWVELLYREVLGIHTAAPVSTVPRVRRPCSLDELADGPLAVLRTDDDDATHSPLPSPWRCGQLELLLSSVRPARPNVTVPTEKFERGLLVNQLQRLWRFLPDISAELAAKAKYSICAHEAKAPASTARLARPATFASAVSGPLELPDSSLDAYLLTSCPCRPSAELRLPFLTTADVKCLSVAAAAEATSTAGVSRPAVTVDLELWLANLALRRCCFCTKFDASAAGVGNGDPGVAAMPTSRCTRVYAPMPSSGAVRHTIATLPACVLSQHTTFCSTATTPLPSLVTTPPPSPSEMPAEWVLVQWWWRAWCDEGAWSQAEDIQRCYALWRILLGHAPPAPSSLAESAASAPPTMAPLLSSLMRLLVGIGRRADATEERVRRAFHCLATLRRVRASELDTSTDAAKEDADVDAAMSAEDEMTLTVDECAALGRLLSPTPCAVSSSASSTTPSTTGAAAAVGTTSEIGSGEHEFITDVQLLLQVEGTKGVTLPLLLSSRWASLLMREHF